MTNVNRVYVSRTSFEVSDGDAQSQAASNGQATLPAPTPGALNSADSEIAMREIFLLLESLASDVRHAGEQRELEAEERQFISEDSAIEALRTKARDEMIGGMVGAVCDFGAAAANGLSAEAKTDAGKGWAQAGVKLADTGTKASDGYFKGLCTNADADHERADNTAQHAHDLAKRAADMTSDGSDLARSVLEHMKQVFDQLNQVKLSVHFA